MATKKTSKKSTQTNQKKTKNAPRKQTARDRELEAHVREDELREKEQKLRIFSVFVFAFSVILFFVAIIDGAGVWNIVHNFYIGLFGRFAAIALPILYLVFSFLLTVVKGKNNIIPETVSVLILILLVSAFIHIVSPSNQTGDDFVNAVTSAYKNAVKSFNGGLFGAVIGWLLLTMGKAPAIIVDLVLVVSIIILLSKTTVNQFFSKPVKKVVEKAAPYIEEQREKRRNRNIDVYLDDEPPKSDGEDEKTDENKQDKSKKKTKAKKKDDNLGDDAMADIIRDINATTAKNKASRSGENADKAEKSIDEIVKDASETEQAKAENKNKSDSGSEEFVVSDDDMNTTVDEYKMPSVDILKVAEQKSTSDISNELKENATLLVDTLSSFGVSATVTDISRGPTVTRYELKPAAGVRISKITNLSDDIALNLAATNVRIEAPIPGKAAVGIEIPNTVSNIVSMRELIDTPDFSAQKSILSAGLGKDIAGNNVYCDLAKMPHLLIAGTTGSGKSVCMNSIIVSILYRATPEQVKLLMIDPKKVEFSKYENIPHLLVPVVTDPRKASGALGWAVSEMLKRYQAFSDYGVRDIEGYNKYVAKHEDMQPMPKVVICIDELADLMMAAPKEVEDSICRLAQMARAAGMHLVIATQRPSVDVITGLIKANISSRIALTVSSQIDSRTILDSGGAEKLLGHGDMLYSPIGASKPLRVQGCFISDEEVEELCDFIKNQGESQYSDEIQKEIEDKAAQDKNASPFLDSGEQGEELDALFDKAVDVVLDSGRASTSFLQRKLGVGYSRGSKIMDQLEEKGIIGAQDGSKPREIKINRQQWIQMQANAPVPEFTAENTEQMSIDDNVIDNQYFSPADDVDES